MSTGHTNTPFSVDDAGRIIDSKGFMVGDVDGTRVLRDWEKENVEHWSRLPGVTYIEIEEEEEYALAELFARAPEMAEEIERLEEENAALRADGLTVSLERDEAEAQRDALAGNAEAHADHCDEKGFAPAATAALRQAIERAKP